MEEQFPETEETQPELLAHHYTEAGLIAQAIPYWQRAGQRATQRSANVEAISHLTTGLELLKILPDTPSAPSKNSRCKLPWDAADSHQRLCGPGSGTGSTPERWELCRQLGETPQLFPVLWGLWVFYRVRAEQTAHELAEQCLRLAQSMQDPALLIWAHYALGMTLFYLGEFARPKTNWSRVLSSTIHSNTLPLSLVWQDPRVTCLSYAALALWYLGYPDQALERSHEALTLAQELSHPFSLAYALDFALSSISTAGRDKQPRSGQKRCWHFLASRGLRTGWHGDYLAGLGAGRARTGRRRDCADTPGLGCLPGHGSRLAAVLLALLAEAYGKVGQARRRAYLAGRGAGCGGKNWGPFLRGGAVSAQGGAYAAVRQVKGQKSTSQKSKT